MKKLIALLMAFVMVMSFAACGGEKEAETEAPKAGDIEAEFGIDLEAAGQQNMSDERASEDVLVETRDTWLGGQMTFALDSDPKTYEDFVAHIGCDATYYEYLADDQERHFIWVAEGDDTAKFLAVFWETPNGWTLYSVGSTNIG